MTCLDVVLFAFILFGVAWVSSICKCISFTKLKDFQLLYLQTYTYIFLPQSLSIEDSTNTYIRLLDVILLSPLRLGWIVSLWFRLDCFYWSDRNSQYLRILFCQLKFVVKHTWLIFWYCNFLYYTFICYFKKQLY